MDGVLLAARLVLTAILLIASVAKLVDVGTFRRALRGFGVPASLVMPLGILLPCAELVIALMLPWGPTATWGGLAAAALFAIFSATIGVNLWQGRTPPCGCFGQFDTKPIGVPTLVRALVLTAGALLLVWRGPGTDIMQVVRDLTSANVVWIIVVGVGASALVIEGALIFMLMQQHGRLLIRLERLEARLLLPAAQTRVAGLPLGSLAPDFQVESPSGRPAALAELIRTAHPVVLIFVDPDCPACTSLSTDLARWRWQFDSRVGIVVVSVRDPRAGRHALAQYGNEDVYLQQDREVADLYKVTGTPTAVLISGTRLIGSQLAEGADAIRELMASLESTTLPGTSPPMAQPALL